MKEFVFGLIGFIIFFSGYLIGVIQGWSQGYDKCSKDTLDQLDDYFENRKIHELMTRKENDNTTK